MSLSIANSLKDFLSIKACLMPLLRRIIFKKLWYVFRYFCFHEILWLLPDSNEHFIFTVYEDK